MTLTLVLKKGFTPRNTYVIYESSITDHSKAIAKVKVFTDKQTNKRTDRQTDGPKTICPRSIDARGGGNKKPLDHSSGVKLNCQVHVVEIYGSKSM